MTALKSLKQIFPIRLFENAIFSCEVHKKKPDDEMYTHLLQKWNLIAGESIFIDDRESNLLPFEKMGGKTFKFDPSKLSESINLLQKILENDNAPEKFAVHFTCFPNLIKIV